MVQSLHRQAVFLGKDKCWGLDAHFLFRPDPLRTAVLTRGKGKAARPGPGKVLRERIERHRDVGKAIQWKGARHFSSTQAGLPDPARQLLECRRDRRRESDMRLSSFG
ncbi:hypothetical protein GCM10027021_00190 [Dyella kyungheensis]